MAGAAYTEGLHELGDSLYAYLQPDGGWGWSNAGLVCDGEHSLLIDTLFDRRLTERMLAAMRRATPAADRIDTLVNTHANGDHCYGNELVGGARIIASERTAAEMEELPPSAFAMLVEQAPNMGEVGEFFLRCFGSFDFRGTRADAARRDVQRRADAPRRRPRGAPDRGRARPHPRRHPGLPAGRADPVLRRHPVPRRASDRVGGTGLELDRRLRADPRDGRRGDRPRPRPAGRQGGGARGQGVLRVPLRAGPRSPRPGDDAGAGGALDRARPLGRVGRGRAAGRQRRHHLPRARGRQRAGQRAASPSSRWPSSPATAADAADGPSAGARSDGAAELDRADPLARLPRRASRPRPETRSTSTATRWGGCPLETPRRLAEVVAATAGASG